MRCGWGRQMARQYLRVKRLSATNRERRRASVRAVGTVPPSITYSVPVIAAARSDTYQESYEIRDFLRSCRPTERDSNERLHEDLFSALIVRARRLCESLRRRDGSVSLHPARRDPHHANSLGSDFL
jgi:hypothetical protein